MTSRRERAWLAVAFLGLPLMLAPGMVAVGSSTSAELIARLTAPDPYPLKSYRAKRWLSASTRGGRMHAAVVAWTALDARGFSYEILDQEGSGLIIGKVLKAALETEQETVAKGVAGQMALTEANYEFGEVNHDRPDVVSLEIRPRRKHLMLIDGAVLFDASSGDLIGVEGSPSKRPSFWTRRVTLSRRYARIGDVRVPVAMESSSDVLMVGASSFTMAFCYSTINDVEIESCDRDRPE